MHEPSARMQRGKKNRLHTVSYARRENPRLRIPMRNNSGLRIRFRRSPRYAACDRPVVDLEPRSLPSWLGYARDLLPWPHLNQHRTLRIRFPSRTGRGGQEFVDFPASKVAVQDWPIGGATNSLFVTKNQTIHVKYNKTVPSASARKPTRRWAMSKSSKSEMGTYAWVQIL